MLYETFDALERSDIATAIRDVFWLFAVIEAVHLVALATLGGGDSSHGSALDRHHFPFAAGPLDLQLHPTHFLYSARRSCSPRVFPWL